MLSFSIFLEDDSISLYFESNTSIDNIAVQNCTTFQFTAIGVKRIGIFYYIHCIDLNTIIYPSNFLP